MKCFFLMLTALLIAVQSDAQTTAKPLRVGVVGLVHTHVHWILGRPDRGDIEIVGIVEPNRDLATRYAQQHGYDMGIVYESLEEMLEAQKPEAVTAFNTIYGHLEVVEACAPRGIHVMVEKPLAVSMAHANQMAALARKHKIHLLTNYETTWYGSNHELHKRVQAEKIGKIRKMVIHDGHPGPIEIGCNIEFLEWLTDPILNGGGALTDFGCYGANLMTWFMDGQKPMSVFAITQQLKPDMYPKVEDEATVILRYPSAQGIIQASWNWPVSRKDTHVYGEKGYIKALDASKLRSRMGDDAELIDETAPDLPRQLNDPFAYLASVVRGTHEPGEDLSSLENNLIVMEILEAAKKSAAEGREVKLTP